MQYRTNYGKEQRPAGPWPGGRPYKGPARLPEGHFDPDELTRRLYVVLAEQRLQAERKQRARGERSDRRDGTRHQEKQQKPAEPAADLITKLRRTESAENKPTHTALAAPPPDVATNQASQYHHVPSQAASQFVRTTTVDNIRNNDLVHKLSKRALKFHLDGPRTVRPAAVPEEGGGHGGETAIAPAKLSRTLQQTQTQRDKVLDRNQFQRTRILEEAAQLDHHEQQPPRKHTLEDEFLRLLRPASRHDKRRNSTGNAADMHSANDNRNHHVRRSLIAMEPLLDVLAEEKYNLSTTNSTTAPLPAEEPPLCRFPPADRTRVDWTQSDEPRAHNGRPKLLLSLPLLRKADSLWTLRGIGRRGSKDSSVQSPTGGSAAGVPEGKGDELSPTKAGKTGFFAKFKR
ncbi:uncharacterized protein B0T15DRAFT_512501 [Chaetomium strumarium]|uniref:Uncharacterized protein n=1 Tax=Chaetomium strumarium TaxID=1170767 RepID=A0AAJ0M0G5_9PEZI|nr:hypothetical protein B0T15DRAFT_512501 [Chaetomium strumarium]